MKVDRPNYSRRQQSLLVVTDGAAFCALCKYKIQKTRYAVYYTDTTFKLL